MKKVLYLSVVSLFIFWMFVVLGNGGNLTKGAISRAQAATTGNVLLTGTVLEYIDLSFSSGQTVSFGNITPGLANAKCADFNTKADVITSASGGYNLAVSDGSNTNSAMIHSDGSTYIPDITGTIATPLVWTSGTTVGVGINLFSGTQKAAGWGTGTTVCDTTFNNWAYVPATATTGHTVTGYHAAADSSYWDWRIAVPLTQKTGTYSGNVLFTSAAVL